MNDRGVTSFEQLLGKFGTAMLVTTSLDGEPRARPMAVAAYEGGLLYFASRAEDEKLQEIAKEHRVAVTLQDGDLYLSITGHARLETRCSNGGEAVAPLDEALVSGRAWRPEPGADRGRTTARGILGS
mgnify:CR=1 FL=1